MTLVSLVMPVHDTNPDWLFDAARSALDDETVPIELVVVDDESREPIEGLLASLGDSRLHVHRISHAGPYGARNAGIAASKGDWIRFIDSDDVVTAGSTGKLIAAAAGDRVIPYGSTLVCDEDLVPQLLIRSTLEGSVTRACASGRWDSRVVSMLFPRDVVAAAGPWDESFRVSGDWDFVLRAVEHAPVRPVDVIAVRYRRHSASVTRTSQIVDGEEARTRIVRRHLERQPEKRDSEEAREAWTNLFLDSAAAYAYRGEWRAALGRLRRAARLDLRGAFVAAARMLLQSLRRRDAS